LKSFRHSWHLSFEAEDLQIGAPYFITLTSTNNVALTTSVYDQMSYDMTDPVPSELSIVTDTVPDAYMDSHVQCQKSQSHVSVTWSPFGEDHSVIERYEGE
jgi:hypothetical protein